MNDNKLWKPLSITHVEYQSGDLFGFIMAWFTLLPIIYIFCLITVVAIRRDLLTVRTRGDFESLFIYFFFLDFLFFGIIC
jgi:hypothetical protein